jgi:hypothetical protein
LSVDDYANQIKQQLGEWWLPAIYRARVLSQRTRAFVFENVKFGARVTVQHTLLGVELKVGRRRILCPDLATARYLSVFARAGCKAIAVPYDITKVSQIADELESSWYRMLLLVDEVARDKSEKFNTRLRGLLFARISAEIAAAGAGAKMPEFKTSTKQRRN